MKKALLLITLLSFCFLKSTSQVKENENNPWIVGIGVSAIDDSGSRLGKLFNFNNNYHFKNPFKFLVEKRFKDDFGLEASFNFNTFEPGKIYNEAVLEESINFFATDLSLKYYATNLVLDKYRSYFEGFVAVGLGRSFYDGEGANTFNLSGGLLLYISNRIRLASQVTGKLSLTNNDVGTNYFQYDIGLIYRIRVK